MPENKDFSDCVYENDKRANDHEHDKRDIKIDYERRRGFRPIMISNHLISSSESGNRNGHPRNRGRPGEPAFSHFNEHHSADCFT